MQSLQENAKNLLDNNAKKGKNYYYTAPSRKKYPHQWSWDSSFHAIVNARLGRTDLAKEEITTLLSKMLPDGTLPHIIFHDRSFASVSNRVLRCYWPHSGRSPLVQPPVVALAAKEIWEQTEDIRFLRKTIPLLERHFVWLTNSRRLGDSKLVSIFSPWESGLDHKPAFDPLLGPVAKLPLGRYFVLYTSEMRMARLKFDGQNIAERGYFNVREVLFNTVYALGLEALGVMFDAVGDTYKAKSCRAICESVEKAILDECYDPDSGLYFDVDVRTGNLLMEPSISCLMPLALGNVPKDRYTELIAHLTNPEEFWLDFPVPSVPQNSRYFQPEDKRYLWRGPTWINTNWFIVNGLKRHGYDDLAETISQASRDLVNQFGFWEYYNPLTGKGGGAKDFGWSTLAAIM